MSAAPQRLRSLLFVPAHVDRFVARAHERSADAVVLDLEDAVPAAAKGTARAALSEALGRVTQRGALAVVRVNHNLLDLARDLDAAVRPGLSALVLPKVESASWIVEIADAVAILEAQRGITAGRVRLILQIETPSALIHLDAIARAHPRVLAITLGPEDFCASLGGAPCDDLLLGPNLQVLCAARAAGIVPLGFIGSIGDYGDLDAFRATVRRARRMGFRGALVVHPNQVAILNEELTPSPDEQAWARRVMVADAIARREGRGAFEVDGRMVDAPVVRRAVEILAMASPEVPQ